jgi:hypothetical protein
MKDDVVFANCTIPIGDKSLVHLLDIRERALAITDDIPMPPVGVCCEEDSVFSAEHNHILNHITLF